ncbi:hypothetical protein EVG20_g6339 [Dentipellis fragilis]|uniref:Uncharacterized protein n=1 Tax=Dentipellis fragilis TaxID=205917 RepID=A0A4Y9YLK6_9AGAM|nr:hypothetical protein EVG20_g6339 [Dentipellis fragilis]
MNRSGILPFGRSCNLLETWVATMGIRDARKMTKRRYYPTQGLVYTLSGVEVAWTHSRIELMATTSPAAGSKHPLANLTPAQRRRRASILRKAYTGDRSPSIPLVRSFRQSIKAQLQQKDDEALDVLEKDINDVVQGVEKEKLRTQWLNERLQEEKKADKELAIRHRRCVQGGDKLKISTQVNWESNYIARQEIDTATQSLSTCKQAINDLGRQVNTRGEGLRDARRHEEDLQRCRH